MPPPPLCPILLLDPLIPPLPRNVSGTKSRSRTVGHRTYRKEERRIPHASVNFFECLLTDWDDDDGGLLSRPAFVHRVRSIARARGLPPVRNITSREAFHKG